MRIHRLVREQLVRAPLDDVFAFFSQAGNLQELTPPWVGFRFLSELPIDMHTDTRIDYRIRLAGVPVRWRTRITSWDPPHGFVDAAERSPYAVWEHTHRFEPVAEGVWMRDEVRYALPLGPLGGLAHFVAVRAALAAIFDYRFDQIERRFGAPRVSELARRSA